MSNEAAVAAIEFALNADDGFAFLRCWSHGAFDVIRRDWPEAPETVFIGADPLNPRDRDNSLSYSVSVARVPHELLWQVTACLNRWRDGEPFNLSGPEKDISDAVYDALRPGARDGLKKFVEGCLAADRAEINDDA